MRCSRLLSVLLVLPAALLCWSCNGGEEEDGGDDASGGTSGSGAGATSGSSSGASAGTGSGGSAGTGGDGGNTPGGSSGTAGTAGSAGTAGTAGTAGSGGGGSGQVVTASDGFCTPRCIENNGYCALVDVGCEAGAEPCLLAAECRPWDSCMPAPPDFSCGPPLTLCIDDDTDDCTVGECPGLCTCSGKDCPDDMVFDENPEVCACVAPLAPALTCADIACPDDFGCEIVLGSAACVKRFEP